MTRIARTTRDIVVASGPEAGDYLQGQLSQDISQYPVEGLGWTFVLAPTGKVEGWGRIRRSGEESYEIDVDSGAGERWVERLERFRLRTEVDFALHPDVPMLAARGPKGDKGVTDRLVSGWLPGGWPGLASADILGEDVTEFVSVLAEIEAGGIEVEDEAMEAFRIRAGVPRWGHEIHEDTIPATLGKWLIDRSVSFSKGCYTGQELVARVDSRGGNVPRLLCGLEVDGPAPLPGTDVTVNGEVIGPVTSSASDTEVGSVALLFVPRAVEVGRSGVDAEVDGSAAKITQIPNPSLVPDEPEKPQWRPFDQPARR